MQYLAHDVCASCVCILAPFFFPWYVGHPEYTPKVSELLLGTYCTTAAGNPHRLLLLTRANPCSVTFGHLNTPNTATSMNCNGGTAAGNE